MREENTITLLIAAMGGEGGGVLTDWVVKAARLEGFAVQATSIPGVAQRTGATTYYIEMAKTKGAKPAFCLSPMAGDVDIFASSEYLETARAIQNGYVTPDKTFLIASTHRVYTLDEKMQSGAAIFVDEKLIEAAKAASRASLLFDMPATGYPLNAVMLGAIAAQLPLSEESFLAAITASGLNLTPNQKGFAAGKTAVSQVLKAKLAQDEVVKAGVERLTAYQNKAHAARYLVQLEAIKPIINDDSHFQELARLLALRLSYEDIAYVAQLKTSKARFITVENEVRTGAKPHVIIDHFKPGIEELASFLPPRLGSWLLALALRKGWLEKSFLGMKIKSNSIFGFLLLKLLSKAKILRPYGLRFQQESAQIAGWLKLIRETYPRSPVLASEVIALANLIKGYGDTYKRGFAHYNAIIETVFHANLRLEKQESAILSLRLAAQKDPEGPLVAQTILQIRNKI